MFTFFLIQRLLLPSFLAIPATSLFVPYFRTPERAVDGASPLRSGVVVFVVLVGRLTGLVMLFSIWTAFWWSRSVVHAAVTPSGPREVLLMAEQTYAWFTLHAVPFLGVPETFDWTQPTHFVGSAASALALTFKIVVTLPMIATVVYFLRGVWEKPPGTLDEDAGRLGHG